jgi:hypothetical protein
LSRRGRRGRYSQGAKVRKQRVFRLEDGVVVTLRGVSAANGQKFKLTFDMIHRRAPASPGDFHLHGGRPGTRQYGLIAEEVATAYPELVTRTATGEVQAVRYQELIPMLVNELQRQQLAIEREQRDVEQQRQRWRDSSTRPSSSSGSWPSCGASWGRRAGVSRSGRSVGSARRPFRDRPRRCVPAWDRLPPCQETRAARATLRGTRRGP